MINEEISTINRFSGTNKALRTQIQLSTKTVLKTIEKVLNIVPKYHYQNKWMVYGVIIGVLFSTILSTLGYQNTWNSLPMGISMGLIFGMLAGKNQDIKVKNMNLQVT